MLEGNGKRQTREKCLKKKKGGFLKDSTCQSNWEGGFLEHPLAHQTEQIRILIEKLNSYKEIVKERDVELENTKMDLGFYKKQGYLTLEPKSDQIKAYESYVKMTEKRNGKDKHKASKSKNEVKHFTYNKWFGFVEKPIKYFCDQFLCHVFLWGFKLGYHYDIIVAVLS